MPGIRIMNSSAATPQDAENRKRTYEGKLVNGQRTPNSAPPRSTSDGAVAAIAGPPMPANTMSGPPPELPHQPPELYRPLSLLVERTAQETFNELNTLLHQMADLKAPPPLNGAFMNGVAGSQADAEVNRQKKLLVMNFAQTNRAKFIKLLVLKGWGDKYAKDMTQLIDIWNWLMKEEYASSSADERMDIIRNWTRDLGQKNPDIRTALGVLSTGKADWMPHVCDSLALCSHELTLSRWASSRKIPCRQSRASSFSGTWTLPPSSGSMSMKPFRGTSRNGVSMTAE